MAWPMSCSRCGCHMVYKAGAGDTTHLICCDCGLRRPDPDVSGRSRPVNQLLSVGMLALLALTAVGLMAIKDKQASQLLDNEELQLNQPRPEGGEGINERRHRRWIMIPGTPGSSLR